MKSFEEIQAVFKEAVSMVRELTGETYTHEDFLEAVEMGRDHIHSSLTMEERDLFMGRSSKK